MSEYTVREEGGCTLVFGSGLPITVFTAIAGGNSAKGKIMSPHLARLACADFAWGTPQAVAAGVAKYTPIALSRTRQHATQEILDMGDEAIVWLATGQHGMSACSIFWKTMGYKPAMLLPVEHPENRYPLDPDDLGRCRLLLEQVSAVRDRFHIMNDACPVWGALVSRWDTMCALMDKEAPEWRDGKGKAPETYAQMTTIIQGERA